MPVNSIGGRSYFLTMTPALHRFTRVQRPARRNEVTAHIMVYIAWLDQNLKEPVKTVNAVNAKEFFAMIKELGRIGIELHTTSIFTPETNGSG